MKQNKKSIFKKITLGFVVLVFAVVSSGCGSAPQGAKVTLKIWKPFVDSDKMNLIIESYRKIHPNVTIEYSKRNIENYEGDLLNALASGTGPDIFSINNTWLPLYLDKVVPAPAKL